MELLCLYDRTEPKTNSGTSIHTLQEKTKNMLQATIFHWKNYQWSSIRRYIVEAPSIEAFERRIDRCGRDHDIVYNYEVALSLGHSDRERNDISLDSSDNDVDIQVWWPSSSKDLSKTNYVDTTFTYRYIYICNKYI